MKNVMQFAAVAAVVGVSTVAGAAQYVVQPNEAASKDAWAYQFGPYGSAFPNMLAVGNTGPTSAHSQQSAVQFDLSSVATTADQVQSAVIRLYLADATVSGFGANPSAAYPISISMYGATSDWTEGSLVWATLPTYNPVAADTEVISTYGLWVEFDVTDLAKGWLDGSVSNYGVRLIQDVMVRNASNIAVIGVFNSASVAGFEPSLVVTTVPQPAAITMMGLAGTALLRRRRR